MPSATRVRVLPTIPRKGLHYLSIALGLIHGLCGAWLINALKDSLFGFSGPVSSFGYIRVIFIGAILFLIPSVLFAMLIARIHPRFWRTVLCGLIYGPSAFAGIFAVILAENPQMLVLETSQPVSVFAIWLSALLGVAVVCGLLTAVVCAAFALGFGIEHVVGRRVVLQTGLVCWSCGYDLGAGHAGVCSECARPFSPEQTCRAWSPRMLRALTRSRWVLLTIFFLTALTPVVYGIITYTIPASRFLRARPSNAILKSGGMMGNWVKRFDSAQWTYINPLSDGWWIADPDSKTTGIIVQYFPESRGDEPRIFVSRACLYDFSVPAQAVVVGDVPSYTMAAPGTLRITAQLSSAQAQAVLKSGNVPPGLIDALRKRADEFGWKEADPMTARTTITANNDQTVDPAPFFPQPSAPDK